MVVVVGFSRVRCLVLLVWLSLSWRRGEPRRVVREIAVVSEDVRLKLQNDEEDDDDTHPQRSPTSVDGGLAFDAACSVGKVCTYTLLRTVCSTSDMRETRRNRSGINSRVQIDGILGFRATQRRSQGDQEGTGGPGKPGHRHAPAIAHQSLLSSKMENNAVHLLVQLVRAAEQEAIILAISGCARPVRTIRALVRMFVFATV